MRLMGGTWWFSGRTRLIFQELRFLSVLTVILDCVRLSGRNGWSFVEAELDDHYHQHSCDCSSNDQGDQQCDNHCNSNCKEVNKDELTGVLSTAQNPKIQPLVEEGKEHRVLGHTNLFEVVSHPGPGVKFDPG